MDSTSSTPSAARTASPKALWVVIGALAIAVAALGGALVHKQVNNSAMQAQAPQATSLAAAPPVRAPDDYKTPEPLPPAQAPAPQPVTAISPPPPPVRAPEVIAQNTASANATAPAPAAPTRKACSVCGHVESVQTVKRQKPTTGVGAVAGGVVGGVVGNQIGSGRGRTLATVAGAVGGGFAGNEVEKRTHTETVYRVGVRMDNGTLRTVETATAPPVGKAVTLKNNVLRPADGQK